MPRLSSAPGTLVDSNVLLDVMTENNEWFEWSSESLAEAAESGPLYINPIIYAEVSVRFERIEDLEAVADVLPGQGVSVVCVSLRRR